MGGEQSTSVGCHGVKFTNLGKKEPIKIVRRSLIIMDENYFGIWDIAIGEHNMGVDSAKSLYLFYHAHTWAQIFSQPL